MTIADAIRPVLDTAVQPLGLAIDDVTVTPAGRRRVVRVTVERVLPEHGDIVEAIAPVSLDEVADATRAISASLDESNALGEQPYTLEVSSPGVGAALKTPRAFRRNVGRLISFDTTIDDESVASMTGRIMRAGESDMSIIIPATKKEPQRELDVDYRDAVGAKVQVEFSRPVPDDGPHPDPTDH